MIKNLHALLVGINEHHPQSRDVDDLKGCINDIDAFEALLLENYAQLDPKICKLSNEQATRDNIIHHFRSHLTANANEQSVVFFYFSGHGSRQAVSKVFQRLMSYSEKRYLKEETLICYESRAVVDDKWIGKDLADKEMAILIEEVAKKGSQVIVILDCCHSGSGTRYLSKKEEQAIEQTPPLAIREVKAREVSQKKPPGFKRRYLDGYYEKMFEKTGKATVPQGKHILMSACRKNQLSSEYTFDGERRGVFSYYLTKILKAYPTISFDQLFTQTRNQVINAPALQHKSDPQIPQFEACGGFDAYSSVMSAYPTMTNASDLTQRKRYLMKYENSQWHIILGALHGLPAEEQELEAINWNIFAEEEEGECLAKAQTYKVLSKSNVVKFIEGRLDTNKHFWAEISSLLSNAAEVSLVDPYHCLPIPADELVSSLFRFIPYATDPTEYTLMVDKANYKILRRGKVVYKEQTSNYTQAIHKLEQILQWRLLLEQTHDQSQLPHVSFPLLFEVKDQVSVELLEAQDFVPIKSRKGAYFQDKRREWVVPFEIFAQNNSEQDLYFTLLYFSSDYEIDVFYNELIPKKSAKIQLTKEKGFSTEGAPETIDYFKLIVSTQRLDNYRVEQRSIEEKKTRSSKVLSLPDDWIAKTLQVVIERE